MSFIKTVLIGGTVWVAGITLLHLRLNLGVGAHLFGGEKPAATDKFSVGFIPVTCHLTCPVTDFINKSMTGEGTFRPMRFNGFPEIKEMFLSNRMEATFILAPLAMQLREQGVPIKIVYLGHRDGTAVVVHKDSGVYDVRDLRGKKVAVPNRFSNQRIMLHRALKKRGMSLDDLTLLEMPPPEMPVALQTKSVDAITSGEPFMARAELDGYGRVLFQAKDEWPGFISCVLAVREDLTRDPAGRDKVQQLVDGIARSGKWLDTSMDNRMGAAQFVSTNYYKQDPQLLAFVLSKPPDRVKYTNLALHRKDFEEIQALAVESGVLNGSVGFDDYCDPSFVKEGGLEPWQWEVKQ